MFIICAWFALFQQLTTTSTRLCLATTVSSSGLCCRLFAF